MKIYIQVEIRVSLYMPHTSFSTESRVHGMSLGAFKRKLQERVAVRIYNGRFLLARPFANFNKNVCISSKSKQKPVTKR